MKTFLEPIASLIYDSLVNMCLFFQGIFDSKWLIILSIVFIISSIFCFIKLCKDEYGNNNVWMMTLSEILIVVVGMLIIFIGMDNFKPYKESDNTVSLISTTAMWILALIHVVICSCNHKALYSICFIIGIIMCSVLLSKFFIIMGVWLFMCMFVGGSSFVGTFTDKNGNSFDIFKRD